MSVAAHIAEDDLGSAQDADAAGLRVALIDIER